MTPRLTRALAATAAALGVLGIALAAAARTACARFDASLSTVYDIPIRNVTRSTDPAVVARGRHLAESVGSCTMSVCHGADLGGGESVDLDALGRLTAPNVTPAGLAATYTDGELARLIQHGVKKDGRSVRLMPSQDFGWLPDQDVDAIVSSLRAATPVDRPSPPIAIAAPVKLLDRLYDFPIDVARRIDHGRMEVVPSPAPTAEYGSFLARACRECHGEHFSGGRIPGMPASMTTPLNLTRDPTGLQGWTFEEFDRTMRTGVRKDGTPLSPFMPIDASSKLDPIEMRALWAFLIVLPPLPFGNR